MNRNKETAIQKLKEHLDLIIDNCRYVIITGRLGWRFYCR